MEIEKIWKDWKVDKFIGEGSFGKVYQIVREDFGHRYISALKVIHIPQNNAEVETIKNEGMTDESVTLYFKSMVEEIVEEFALMSKLKGNSTIVSYEDHVVVPVEDSFGWDIYIRMELLTPLFDYLKQHTLSREQIIQLGIDICAALEVCQKFNIIHRDIKPENIFVSDLGKFKLGDFGIARKLEKTTSGLSKKGTYSYMAPEVYKGFSYNETVDIYSLGIVLYRFLNKNRTPFLPPSPQPIRYSDKENANILRMSGKELPMPCDADEKLGSIVLKACAYEPEKRYAAAVEMRKDLELLLFAEEHTAKQEPESNPIIAEAVQKPADDVVDENEEEETVFMKPDQKSADDVIDENEEEETVFIKPDQKPADDVIDENEEEETVFIKPEPNTEVSEPETEMPDQAGEQKTEIPEPVPKKKKRILPVIIGVAAAAVIACFVLFLRPSTLTVPTLKNLTVYEATVLLEENGLVLKVEKEEYSDTVEQGKIIAQSIAEGENVEKSTEIAVTVSLGTQSEVPDLAGLTEKEAKESLDKLGYTLEITKKENSDKVKKGKIISQKPEAGTKLESGEKISVVISKGKKKAEVPNVVGLTEEEAQAALSSENLTCVLEEAYSDEAAQGTVISQSVAAGEKVKQKTEVTVVVSKGAEPKEEPEDEPKQNSNAQQKNSSSSGNNSNSGSGSNSSSKPTVPQPTEPATPQPTEPAAPQPAEPAAPQPEVPATEPSGGESSGGGVVIDLGDM